MLLNVLGFGNGLMLAVAACASIVMLLLGILVLKALLRSLPGNDPGLASMRMQLREPADADLGQRIHDALATPPEVVSIDDLERPELFIPGVEALRRPSGPPSG